MSGFFNLVKFGLKKATGKGEAIKKVDVASDITKKRKIQDDVIKRRDEILRDYKITDQKQKIELRKKANQPEINRKMAAIQDRGRVKKMGGGMMSRRMSYRVGTPKKQTNVQKIKKTFGPKSLGMQSVIYGLDKNPKITAADPKAKFIAAANKKKKKV
jgi:hypothetical protein